MFTTNSFACYRHLVKSDGRRAKNTSLDRLRIYSRPVTDEDHVCKNCRGAPGGQNRDIHLMFAGARLQRAIGATSRLPSLAPLRCARQLGVHDMQQASRKAESGNHKHAVNDIYVGMKLPIIKLMSSKCRC